jgi:hypothetical protein
MIEEQKDDSGSVPLPFGKQTVGCLYGEINYKQKYSGSSDVGITPVSYIVKGGQTNSTAYCATLE